MGTSRPPLVGPVMLVKHRAWKLSPFLWVTIRPFSTTQVGVLDGGTVVLEAKLVLLMLEVVGSLDREEEEFWLGFGTLETDFEVKVELVDNVPFEPGSEELLEGVLVG